MKNPNTVSPREIDIYEMPSTYRHAKMDTDKIFEELKHYTGTYNLSEDEDEIVISAIRTLLFRGFNKGDILKKGLSMNSKWV